MIFKGQIPFRNKTIMEQVNTFTYLTSRLSYKKKRKCLKNLVKFYKFWEF